MLADFFNLQALEQPPSVLVFVVAESLRLTIMALQMQSIREKRRDQTDPTLNSLEIERVRRFGDLRSFRAGEPLQTMGQTAAGLTVIVAGKVEVTERDHFDSRKPIAIHGPGNFMGELAQLADRPALVDAIALESVEALVSHHLCALANREKTAIQLAQILCASS